MDKWPARSTGESRWRMFREVGGRGALHWPQGDDGFGQNRLDCYEETERTLSWWRNRILSTPAPPRYSTFPKSLWCYRQRRGRQVLHHAVVWPSLLGHAACPHHLGSTCLKLAAGILGDRIRIAARHKVTNYRLFANCKNVDQYVNE